MKKNVKVVCMASTVCTAVTAMEPHVTEYRAGVIAPLAGWAWHARKSVMKAHMVLTVRKPVPARIACRVIR